MTDRKVIITGSTRSNGEYLAALLSAFAGVPSGLGWLTDLKQPKPDRSGLPSGASVIRRAEQTRKRLEALVGGGWKIEFQPHQHLGLQNSTRGERRRAQLGRS